MILIILLPFIDLLIFYLGLYLLSTTAATQALGYLLILLSLIFSIVSVVVGSKKYLKAQKPKTRALYYFVTASGLAMWTYLVVMLLLLLFIPIIASFI